MRVDEIADQTGGMIYRKLRPYLEKHPRIHATLFVALVVGTVLVSNPIGPIGAMLHRGSLGTFYSTSCAKVDLPISHCVGEVVSSGGRVEHGVVLRGYLQYEPPRRIRNVRLVDTPLERVAIPPYRFLILSPSIAYSLFMIVFLVRFLWFRATRFPKLVDWTFGILGVAGILGYIAHPI